MYIYKSFNKCTGSLYLCPRFQGRDALLFTHQSSTNSNLQHLSNEDSESSPHLQSRNSWTTIRFLQKRYTQARAEDDSARTEGYPACPR